MIAKIVDETLRSVAVAYAYNAWSRLISLVHTMHSASSLRYSPPRRYQRGSCRLISPHPVLQDQFASIGYAKNPSQMPDRRDDLCYKIKVNSKPGDGIASEHTSLLPVFSLKLIPLLTTIAQNVNLESPGSSCQLARYDEGDMAGCGLHAVKERAGVGRHDLFSASA